MIKVDSPSYDEALNWLIQMATLMELGSTFHYNSCTSDILASYYRMMCLISTFQLRSLTHLQHLPVLAFPAPHCYVLAASHPVIPLNVFDSAVPPFLKRKPQSLG